MESLECLFCTDMKCLWADRKSGTLNMYEPIPLSNFCHVSIPPHVSLSSETSTAILQELLAVCPDSALAKHRWAHQICMLYSWKLYWEDLWTLSMHDYIIGNHGAHVAENMHEWQSGPDKTTCGFVDPVNLPPLSAVMENLIRALKHLWNRKRHCKGWTSSIVKTLKVSK